MPEAVLQLSFRTVLVHQTPRVSAKHARTGIPEVEMIFMHPRERYAVARSRNNRETRDQNSSADV